MEIIIPKQQVDVTALVDGVSFPLKLEVQSVVVAPPPPPPPVPPPVIVKFEATPLTAQVGDLVLLSWEVTGADLITINGADVVSRGTKFVEMMTAVTWTGTLVATKVGAPSITVRQVSVTVTEPIPPPVPTIPGVILNTNTPRLPLLFVGTRGTQIVIDHPTPPRIHPDPNIWAVKDGLWDDPSVWNLGRVPKDGDYVAVPHLSVDHSANRTITAQNIIHTDGLFTIGTEANPVPKGRKIRVILIDGAFATTDVLQYGNGLLSTGKFEVWTERKPKARVRSMGALGPTILGSAFMSSVTDWEVGDKVVIADTRRPRGRDTNGDPLPYEDGYLVGSEVRTLSAIGGGLLTADFTSPLTFFHPVHRDKFDVIVGRPTIANLTRDVVFEAETFGKSHVMFGHSAEPKITGAEFKNLGRTLVDPISATNIKGRYACHLHHTHGTTKARISHCSVWSDVPLNPLKWAYTVHGTHFNQFIECVGYNYSGWIFGEEDGNEVGNLYEECCAIACRSYGRYPSRGDGDGDPARRGDDRGYNGNGFWMRGSRAVIRNCDALDCVIGFNCWQFGLSESLIGPDGNNFNPHAFGLDWQGLYIGGGRCAHGIEIWYVGMNGSVPLPNQPLSIVKDAVTFACYQNGYNNYVCKGVRFIGGKTVNCRFGNAGSEDYARHDFKITGHEFHYCDLAFGPSTVGELQEMIDCVVAGCSTGISSGTRWGCRQAELELPRRVIIRSTTFVGTPVCYQRNGQNGLGAGDTNCRALDEFLVINHNGVEGDNFEVFMQEQAPNYVMRSSESRLGVIGPASPGSGYWVAGTDTPGMTNAQVKASKGYCWGGKLAPAGASVRLGVMGLVAPITNVVVG